MSVSRAQTILAEADLRPHLTEQWVMSELGPEFDAQAAEVCGLYVDPHPASLSGRRREWTPDPERYERNLISTCSAASDQCDGTSTSSSRAASRLARSDIAEPARDEGGGKPGHESDVCRRGSGVKSEEVEQECLGVCPADRNCLHPSEFAVRAPCRCEDLRSRARCGAREPQREREHRERERGVQCGDAGRFGAREHDLHRVEHDKAQRCRRPPSGFAGRRAPG